MEEPNILVKTALNEAVQKVNEGLSPTAALKKVASDLDLNPNYIQRTGEALNVALHYKHFKTASDRSTEFDIADIPKVIADVFTVQEKTAAEYSAEHFPVNESTETVFNYNRMLSNPIYKKAFLEIANATETHDSFETTFNTVYEKSANYIQKLAKQAEEAEVAKVAAELELDKQFSVLADEFKKDAAYRATFEEFESQVFAKHGSAAVPYLDFLHKVAGNKEERGVHDAKYLMFTPCKQAEMFDELVSAADSYMSTAKQAEKATEDLSFENSFMKECKTMMGKPAASPRCPNCNCVIGKHKQGCNCAHENHKKAEESVEEPEPTDPVLQEIKKKASAKNDLAVATTKDPVLVQAMEKEAFFGGLGGLLGVGSLLAGPVHDMAHEQTSEAFSSNFNHNATPGGTKPNLTLDNMERKLLLQELMLTDPILSKVNPTKVAKAFEQLLRLSPEISKQKEVVRAELRAMVASQALSKHDAELMAKLDMGMVKRQVSTHQFNKGNIEHFKL
jgi:hypothetical protein